jgi:3-dehydroquinate dehydratase / shikimate dehydrogenase
LQVEILGAGGAARAVVAALLEYDCTVTVYGRTAARAERLAQELRCQWKPWEERRHCAGDVLINCTPVGLWPGTEESPLPAEALRPQTLVFDTIYHPVQTLLLRTARSRGCETVSGVPMFIGQAAAQFERWHGTRAPTEVMAGAFRAEAAWQL